MWPSRSYFHYISLFDTNHAHKTITISKKRYEIGSPMHIGAILILESNLHFWLIMSKSQKQWSEIHFYCNFRHRIRFWGQMSHRKGPCGPKMDIFGFMGFWYLRAFTTISHPFFGAYGLVSANYNLLTTLTNIFWQYNPNPAPNDTFHGP